MKTKQLIFPTLVLLIMVSGSFAVGVTAQDVANPEEVFEMYLLSPNTNEARNTWSSLMATELPKAGIGVRDHVSAGWAIVGPRTFSYPAFDVGIPEGGDAEAGDGIPTHRNAGFDSAFIGLSGALAYDPTGSYSTETLSPNGLNFAWYQNQTVTEWIQDYTQELDTTARNAIAADIQAALYDQQPYIPLVNTEALWAYDQDLTIDETDLLMLGTLNYGDQWADVAHPSNPDFVYGHSYDLTEFVPFVQQSYIAAAYMNPIFVGLYERDRNDGPNYGYYPVLADGQPTWNSENTIATVDINPAATFSDGSPVEAWDVVNTFRMHLTAGAASTLQGDISPFLTSNSSISLVDADTIQFKFDNPYFLAQGLMSLGVMDDDVIGNYTSGVQPIYANNDTSDLGSGPAEAGYNFNADPLTYGIGAGPFAYDTIEESNGNVRLTAVSNYWNGAVASDSVSYLKYTKQNVLPLIGDDSAQEVHIADAQFGVTSGEVESAAGANSTAVADFGTQFLTINMNHPILGTGVQTPLGLEDPSRAAEAAKYVRKAISHMVPRDTIVSDILEGRGVPGTTLWPNVAAGYDDTLQPYEYSVDKAREMLEMAGYDIVLPTEEQVDTGDLSLDIMPVVLLAFMSSLVLRTIQKRRN